MDLQPDENQELLRQTLARFLERRLPFDARRAQRSGADFMAFWRALEDELGIAAAGLPESAGGFGGGAEGEAIVAGGMGAALAVTPYIPAFVLAANLLDGVGRVDLARQIAAGEKVIVVAVEESQTRGDIAAIETRAVPVAGGWHLAGRKVAVDFASEADVVVLPAFTEDGAFALFAAPRAELVPSLKPYALIDDTPAADILLEGLELPVTALLATGSEALAATEVALDRARAALCAEAAALAEVMVADTIAYTREREQFGVPLASFQALQHRMVDMWMASQEMSAAALLAALKPDSSEAVSAAKATCSEGLRLIGQETVQLHGAMGLTEELRVGHYFKRATVLEHKLGSAAVHVERYRRARFAA